MKTQKIFLAALFVITLNFTASATLAQPTAPRARAIAVKATKSVLTELYFGRSRNEGAEVTEEEWAKFVDDEVAVRFPSGFTVLDAMGQWQGGKEKSKVIVIIYPAALWKENNKKLDNIREAYKKAFQQKFVLRMDVRNGVTVL